MGSPGVERPELVENEGLEQDAGFEGRGPVAMQTGQCALHAAIEEVELGVGNLFDFGTLAVGRQEPAEQRIFKNAEIALDGGACNAYVSGDAWRTAAAQGYRSNGAFAPAHGQRRTGRQGPSQ